jgi:hypothetical protein
LGLGGAGCGSSGPLTAAELSRQATAICKQRDASVVTLRKKYRQNMVAMYRSAVPIEAKTVDGLAKLKPPASARATYERFVAIQRIYLRELKGLVAGRTRSGGTTPDRTHEVERITGRLGIEACQ